MSHCSTDLLIVTVHYVETSVQSMLIEGLTICNRSYMAKCHSYSCREVSSCCLIKQLQQSKMHLLWGVIGKLMLTLANMTLPETERLCTRLSSYY